MFPSAQTPETYSAHTDAGPAPIHIRVHTLWTLYPIIDPSQQTSYTLPAFSQARVCVCVGGWIFSCYLYLDICPTSALPPQPSSPSPQRRLREGGQAWSPWQPRTLHLGRRRCWEAALAFAQALALSGARGAGGRRQWGEWGRKAQDDHLDPGEGSYRPGPRTLQWQMGIMAPEQHGEEGDSPAEHLQSGPPPQPYRLQHPQTSLILEKNPFTAPLPGTPPPRRGGAVREWGWGTHTALKTTRALASFVCHSLGGPMAPSCIPTLDPLPGSW